MITIIGLIARSANNIMGLNGDLPWPHNAQDLRWFKTLTAGDPILMGRKTFDSLPGILPGRHHYVVSSKHRTHDNPYVTYVLPHHVPNLINKLSWEKEHARLYVVGGKQILETYSILFDAFLIRTFDFNIDVTETDEVVEFPTETLHKMQLVMSERWSDSVTETYTSPYAL